MATAIENLCLALYGYILKNHILNSHISHLFHSGGYVRRGAFTIAAGFVHRGVCSGFQHLENGYQHLTILYSHLNICYHHLRNCCLYLNDRYPRLDDIITFIVKQMKIYGLYFPQLKDSHNPPTGLLSKTKGLSLKDILFRLRVIPN